MIWRAFSERLLVMSRELTQLSLAKEAAEQRSADLERTLANNKQASMLAVDEIETQVGQRVSSLTSMLRLAEQQAESATAQARTKVEWAEKQRSELSEREKEVGETEGKLREREWSAGELQRKLTEQEARQVALESSLKQREGALEEREGTLREELATASGGNAEAAEMRRQLETQLSEVDFARQRLDGDVDALEQARAAIDAKDRALSQQTAELKMAVMEHEAECKDVDREKQRAQQGSMQVQNDMTLLERDATNLRQREVALVEKESRQARREAEWDSGRRHQESRVSSQSGA